MKKGLKLLCTLMMGLCLLTGCSSNEDEISMDEFIDKVVEAEEENGCNYRASASYNKYFYHGNGIVDNTEVHFENIVEYNDTNGYMDDEYSYDFTPYISSMLHISFKTYYQSDVEYSKKDDGSWKKVEPPTSKITDYELTFSNNSNKVSLDDFQFFMNLEAIEKGNIAYNKDSETYTVTISFTDLLNTEELIDLFTDSDEKAEKFKNKDLDGMNDFKIRYTFDKEYHLTRIKTDEVYLSDGTMKKWNIEFSDYGIVQLNEVLPSDEIINSAEVLIKK